ncbi:Beta-lactamase superfamily domain-containing protein [Roseomonas rosea]|uniref:Beta-lactamase superfamily domain-containing protein n=1 Tax=Muricoccus roseus TaxID=198092 RepID=A0A1M6MSH4_9PROT|nr:MBL fold metallo-hydrolase [Roseomonas rosea]SHJ86458.1 Beta-lactamase superfamily domain-containing protein [Roseomonas rosea]
MASVTLLGTGGPRIDPARHCAALLLRTGEEEVLIDAGRGCVQGLAEAGADLGRLSRLLITHHHFDHIGDLYDVALTTWFEGRKHPLLIQGPPDTQRITEALLTQVYDKDHTWRGLGEPTFGGWAPVEAEDLAPGEWIEGHGWRATAREVLHGNGLGTLPEAFLRRWICYGYRFEIGGRVFAFSGDTVDCPGLRELAQGADVLVQCCWAASAELTTEHLRRLSRHTLACGDTVGKIAAECGVKTLVLTHHRPRRDPAMLDVLAEEVARDFSGRLLIGADGMEVAI